MKAPLKIAPASAKISDTSSVETPTKGLANIPTGSRLHAPDFLISLENITKRFPGVLALKNCRFDLMMGEVHALVGENGAGKSTLMKILAGMLPMDSGQIRMEGHLVEIPTPGAAQLLGVSFIHQEPVLMHHLTAAQNIFIGREPRGCCGLFLDEEALNQRTKRIFERMHLVLSPRAPVNELTIANQQMVEIAKALSFNSRVLIMDDPTSVLSNAEVEDLFRIIRQLQSYGVCVIYISHQIDEVRQISNRITVIRDGQYVATMPTENTSTESIINMMVGRQLDNRRRTISDNPKNKIVLEVRGLCRGKQIRDVSFTLHKGEILGLAGLRGAGRTEVARAIFGADPIDAGDVFVHGTKVKIKSPRDAVKYGIGYLSENRKDFGLALGLDVKTNVTLSNTNDFLTHGLFLDHQIIRFTAQHLVQRLRIKTPSVEQLVRLLSNGNQQKALIAKWLLRDCDILFFDEPTQGIDVGVKNEIYKLLDTLVQRGKAIVVVTSELPELLRMSHRILIMCEGRITGELMASQASPKKIMQLAMHRESSISLDQIIHSKYKLSMEDPQNALVHVPLPSGEDSLFSVLKEKIFYSIRQKLLAFASLLTLLVFFSLASPNFREPNNLVSILQSTAVSGILAIACTFIIIAAGIDLSVGTLMTLCAVIAGVTLTCWGMPLFVGIMAAIAFGALCGCTSGILIAKLKIPPFIATLGLMMLYKGLSVIITGARPIYFNDEDTPGFSFISRGSLIGNLFPHFPIPNAVLIMFLLAIASHVILQKTILGRYTFALAINEEALRLSGVNVDFWKIIVYTFAGGICGIAGLLIASRLSSAQPALGQGYELDAIAAVVIGGTSLSGGSGTIVGTILGVFIMSVLINGLRIMSVAQEWQTVLTGMIIILAAYVDIARRYRQ